MASSARQVWLHLVCLALIHLPHRKKSSEGKGGRRVKKQKALQKKVEEGKYVPKRFNPKLKVPSGVDPKSQLRCDWVEAVEIGSGSDSLSDRPNIDSA